jgi:hypothetical protein
VSDEALKEWAARFPHASRGWLAKCPDCGRVMDRRYDDHRMHWFTAPPRLGGFMLMEHFCVPCGEGRLRRGENLNLKVPHLLPRPSSNEPVV